MRYSSTVVKSTVSSSLAAASMRTLRTIAHYGGIPRTARQTTTHLAAQLAATLSCPDYQLFLRRVLTPADRALWHALWRNPRTSPPLTHLPCPWGAPWADLATMNPLTRLCAVGAIVPHRTAHGITLHLPRQWRRIMAVACPPTSLPDSQRYALGYANLVDLLTQCAVQPRPVQQNPWVTRLALQAGWLAQRLGCWRITPAGHGVLQLPWHEQARVVQHQLIQHPPLRHPVPRWRQIDWHALTTTLTTIMAQQSTQPYHDVVAHVVAHPTWGSLALPDRVRIVRDWLTTVLIPAGIASRTQAWLHWHGWRVLEPHVPALTTTTLPDHPLLPADLRLWAYQWGERTCSGWQITPQSIAQGRDRGGTPSLWAAPLIRHYGHVPAPLQRVFDRVKQHPPVRISTQIILEADAATVAQLRTTPTLVPLLGRAVSSTAVCIDPKHYGTLQRRLHAPPPHERPLPANAATHTTILGLRIAAQHAPALAAQLHAHATTLLRQLSPLEQSHVEDQWSIIDHSRNATAADTPLPAGSPAPPTLPQTLVERPIDHAQHTQQALTLRYYTPSTHSITRRTIRPLERSGIYLRAWCERANAERTFRLDRIVQLE